MFPIKLDKKTARSTDPEVTIANGRKINTSLQREYANIRIVSDLQYTPLHVAAEYEDSEGCRYLLSQGADESLTNIFGRTARDIAIRNNDSTFLKVLDESIVSGRDRQINSLTSQLTESSNECYNLRSRKRKLEEDVSALTDTVSRTTVERDTWKRRCETIRDTRK